LVRERYRQFLGDKTEVGHWRRIERVGEYFVGCHIVGKRKGDTVGSKRERDDQRPRAARV